ncbi:hypothetical protein XM38_026190 [Halomicronema hongdechloris C2206]|uniref:Uncharacterized protein n=1 Tax=Halomicronema hongdechloris C2206 TaxID=1641165 RepID=A0A1Z3HN18_9CYAN|nr:hypothetical protein [Halomicronema hongdechloris]ASC71665.1 hypothetical protein XM38_026190 [Halomicronema hongdechloris C2206]
MDDFAVIDLGYQPGDHPANRVFRRVVAFLQAQCSEIKSSPS